MKKLFAILAVIAIFAIAPYFVGLKAENHIRQLLDLLNQSPEVEIKIVEYERSWFSTTAKLEMTVKMPDELALGIDPVLTIMEDITHGPILWKTHGPGIGLIDSNETIILPDYLQAELDNIDAVDDETLEIKSRTGFTGFTTSYISVRQIILKANGNSLTIKPLEAELGFDFEGHFSGNIDWQGLEITEQGQQQIVLDNFYSEFDQQLIAGSVFNGNVLYSGPFSMTLEKIYVVEPATQDELKLGNISLTADSEIAQEMLHMDMAFKIADIRVKDLQFNDFIYDASFNNLDLKSLQNLAELLSENQSQPSLMAEKFLGNATDLLSTFLEKDPNFTINNLKLITEDGTLSSQAKLSFNKALFDKNNLDSLVVAIQLEASGEAPEAFFTKMGYEDSIEPMVMQGLLIREAPMLKFNFSYNENGALVNGEPLPFGAVTP